MRAAASRWLEAIRTGFWFLPTLMLILAGVLALVLLRVDRAVDPGLTATLAWAYTGGPEGARSLLSTIAGSMITAASVTFSLASVALSIASQQYGSRVLRNFMRDRVTQVLLGTFVATFIYCVLVVRVIRGSDQGGGFVPAISVTVAIALSLASLVLLIYFIHHVSTSIQASHIIRVIAEDLEGAIPKLYPSTTGEPKQLPVSPEDMPEMQTLYAPKSGYLQTIDLDNLMRLASAADAILTVRVQPGDHLLQGDPLADVRSQGPFPEKHLATAIKAFFLNRERTPAQDIRYHFQQLTDVAIRALSPGINDPFTAVNSIDELAAAMLLFVHRAHVNPARKDEAGKLRLLVPSPGTAQILEETVGHLALYGTSDHFVMDALRRVLNNLPSPLMEPADTATVTRLLSELDRLQAAADSSS